MGLSVCLICKNERRYLRRWLQQVEQFADEIIVVDTGTSDGSLTVFDDHPTVQLAHYVWADDFAAARNFSLSLANEEWILVLDADETVVDPTCLRPLLERDTVMAYYLRFRHFQPADSLTKYEEAHQVRLFRNDPAIVFEGVLQESVTASVRRQGGSIKVARAVVVQHDGFRSDVVQGSASRCKRNARILERALHDEPNNPALLFQFGLVHRRRQPEILERSLLHALRVSTEGTSPRLLEQVHMRLSQHYLDGNQLEPCKRHAEDCLQHNPNNLIAHSCLVVALVEEGRFVEALPLVEFVVNHGQNILSNWPDFCRMAEILRSQIQGS